jgi:hypothetical protein
MRNSLDGPISTTDKAAIHPRNPRWVQPAQPDPALAVR